MVRGVGCGWEGGCVDGEGSVLWGVWIGRSGKGLCGWGGECG